MSLDRDYKGKRNVHTTWILDRKDFVDLVVVPQSLQLFSGPTKKHEHKLRQLYNFIILLLFRRNICNFL